MGRLRKLSDQEIAALHGRLKVFVQSQQTTNSPRMHVGDEIECEVALDSLICPLHQTEKFFFADFLDRLRQEFGREANLYDEPEPGGRFRKMINLPILVEEDTYSHKGGGEEFGSHRFQTVSSARSVAKTPSRERTMVYFFVDAFLWFFIWHRFSSGTHGLY